MFVPGHGGGWDRCPQTTISKSFTQGESIDELARDLEKLLEQASPELPAEIRDSELRFYLINSLPEQVSLQLKLQPKVSYVETIAKARELRLIYDKNNELVHQA